MCVGTGQGAAGIYELFKLKKYECIRKKYY